MKELKERSEDDLLDVIREKYLGKVVTDSLSPAGNWLNFQVEDIERGKSKLSIEVRREMSNPYGAIHGGMMSLLIDETIGWAVLSLNMEQHYTSIDLDVNFLYMAMEGERLTASAEVLRAGKKVIHVTCQVRNEKGHLLANATSNLSSTSKAIIER